MNYCILTRIIIAAVCLFGLVLGSGQAVQAAPAFNQNSSRSNNAKAGIGEESGEGEAIIDNMRTRLNELEARLQALGLLSAQVEQELAAIDALQDEIQSLSEQARQAQADEAAAAEQLVAQYDEATRIFNEQVAPVLDPDVAQAVITALDGASKEAAKMSSSGGVTVASGDVTGDGLDNSVSEALDEIRGAAAELKKLVEKATSGLKDTLKTQV